MGKKFKKETTPINKYAKFCQAPRQQQSDKAAVSLAPELISCRNLVCLYFMKNIQASALGVHLRSSIVRSVWWRSEGWCLLRELYYDVRVFC